MDNPFFRAPLPPDASQPELQRYHTASRRVHLLDKEALCCALRKSPVLSHHQLHKCQTGCSKGVVDPGMGV